MEETKLKCLVCEVPITLEYLKTYSREALSSLRGLASLALRKTPPKKGPGRGHKGPMEAK